MVQIGRLIIERRVLPVFRYFSVAFQQVVELFVLVLHHPQHCSARINCAKYVEPFFDKHCHVEVNW